MTRAVSIEAVLIALAAAIAFALAALLLLPRRVEPGSLLLVAFVLLLLQGLLRDLARLARSPASTAPREAQCVCAESVLGVAGVVAGLCVLGAGIGAPFDMTPWRWAACVGVTGAAGLALRDLVIGWSPLPLPLPLSLRRERDHRDIVVRWRR